MTDIVPSPCVSICALDADDICVGCFRSGSEISHWGKLDSDTQRQVLACCQQRMQGHPVACLIATRGTAS